MVSQKDSGYRKNFSLIVTFIALISLVFVMSLFLAFNFSKKNIENDFVSAKTNVLEESLKPYNDFFLNKLPEISFYNGYLDSASASKFVDTVLRKYPFIKKVVFYDAEVKNVKYLDNGVNYGDLSIGMKNVYQFGRHIPKDSVKLYGENEIRNYAGLEDFNKASFKLGLFVKVLDTTKTPNQEDLFTNFTNIQANRIDYFNIPSFEILKTYKRMMMNTLEMRPVYQQDMLSFELDPSKIKIKNTRPLLYQSVRIEPVSYDPLDTSSAYITGEITLGGPFLDYKLFFYILKILCRKGNLQLFSAHCRPVISILWDVNFGSFSHFQKFEY